MRSRIGISKKQREQELWETVSACINGNGVIMFIALARHTGWGKKRMNAFMETYNEVQEEYHKHERDGAFKYMVDKELGAIGIDMNEMLPKPIDFMQHKRNEDKEKEKCKAKITKAKAQELRNKVVGFKSYADSIKAAELHHE